MRFLIFALLASGFLAGCTSNSTSSVSTEPGAREMSKYTRNVHMPIPVASDDLEKVRLAILVAMQKAPRAKWILEGEQPGAIFSRFDYRGATIILKIVYSESQVSLQYVDANGGFECEDLENGICYSATRKYFGYSKRLRMSIIEYLDAYGLTPAVEEA